MGVLKMLSVAKYSELEELDSVILDTFLPTGKRSTSLIYGRIVSNTFTKAKIPSFPGYNQTVQEVPPGNGNGAHIHKNTGIFLFLDGKWEIGYGYDACEKEVLEGGQSWLGRAGYSLTRKLLKKRGNMELSAMTGVLSLMIQRENQSTT